MMRTTLATMLLLMMAAALLCAAYAVPGLTPAARADEPAGEAPPKGTSDESTDDAEDGDDGNVTFFPGVRGISGKELERIIREREQRKKEEERKNRRHAENRQDPDDSSGTPAADTGSTTGPKPADTPKESAPPAVVAPPDDPALKGVELSDEAKDFLKKLKLMTLRCEWLLETADEIRVDGEADATALGNEALIHYILRYTKRSTKETRAYQAALKLPLLVYQYVFEQSASALAYQKKNRPVDLPKEATAVANACAERLTTVWRSTLLASAELYTRLQMVDAADAIYATLLKKFPKDEAIVKSHKAFLDVKNAEKPTTPPGVSSGGAGGRRYDTQNDDAGGEEGSTPAERYGDRYRR